MKTPKGFDPALTKEEHHRVGLATRWLADQMGLRDWTVEINYEAETDEDVYATCSIPDNRRFACIALFPGWGKLSLNDKLQTLVHELMHCHLAALQTDVYEVVPPLVGKAHWETIESALDNEVETAVDNIAIAWATKMSMTEFSKIISGKK